MKNLIYIFAFSLFLLACSGGGDKAQNNEQGDEIPGSEQTEVPASIAEGKGVGEVTEVELTSPLDQERIARGKAVYEMKCQACHRLDKTRVVGPGWEGLTSKRKPEWIMNMITNVEMMLEKDPEAQKLLEECLTRMPNQNVSVEDARDIFEFMRQNDGQK